MVCGSEEIAGMCPMRYVRPHDQDARDRAECVAWCFMVSDGRDRASHADWREAWKGIEPPLSIVTWPG